MRSLSLALCALAATPAFAFAEETLSYALVPIDAPSYASVGKRLDGALRAAVMESPAATVRAAATPDATLSMLQDTFECGPAGGDWPACMAKVGVPIAADRIIWGRLAYDDDTWVLKLRMLDVARRRMVQALDRTVPDSPKAVDQLTLVVAGFVGGGQATAVPKARLRIVSAPPKASVIVDGLSVDPTPVTVTVLAGLHEVAVSVPGMGTERRTVDAAPGETRVAFRFIEPQVTPESVAEVLPDPKLDWRFYGAIGSITVAAVAAAGFIHFDSKAAADLARANVLVGEATVDANGMVALTPDQNARYDGLQSSFDQNQNYRYSCLFGAITAGIVGGVLLHQWSSTAMVTPTPGGVAITGSF